MRIKKECMIEVDKKLSFYASILIENGANVTFLNAPEGKEKLTLVNDGYFPHLKRILESPIQ